MCGIIGYIGKKEVVPVLVEGLKKLEYRGYDSAGICTLSDNGLEIIKRKGKVSEIAEEVLSKKLRGNIGIAHTRWATHGTPNEINSHPHTCCNKNIAIVHNGIIENYSLLKEMLLSEGHKIISETDSEIIAHLVEKFYKNDIEEAVAKALKLIKGSFGLAVIHKAENKIVAARRDSPIVLGLGDEEMFIASDATALLSHTKKVIYLDDNEIALISKNSYSVKNLNLKPVSKKVHKTNLDVLQTEKGGFKHFLLKEIFEQPLAVKNAIKGRIKNNRVCLGFDTKQLNKLKRVIITACGTSWHSALIGKYLIESIAKIPVEVDYASEFRYRNPVLNKDDSVILISQSGETADTLAALREAKSKNVRTMAIVNVLGSTIEREADSCIYLHAGPEISVASTKAFTSQILVLLLLALQLSQKKGQEINKKLIKELNKLPIKIEKVLNQKETISKIAKELHSYNNFLCLGRGINFPVALEGALKIKEISYIHAEGYPAAEMKHGPIALIDKNMPVIFIINKGKLFEKSLSNLQEIKSRGGKVIAITQVCENFQSLADKELNALEKLSDYVIKIPYASEELSPIINVIPLQLLAYYLADFRGLDIDKPRNLAKSVTVE